MERVIDGRVRAENYHESDATVLGLDLLLRTNGP
jgi:hypothetical protein